MARDMEMLQRLAELGMQLAERVARQALEEPISHAKSQSTETPFPKRADPNLMFVRLSRMVRDTITLKLRIAAGIIPPPPRARPEPAPPPEPSTIAPEPPEDPRRPHLIRYFREAIDITRQKRKTPISHPEIEACINTELARDPQHRLSGRAVLQNICKSLGLPFYAARVHSDLLRPPRPTPISKP